MKTKRGRDQFGNKKRWSAKKKQKEATFGMGYSSAMATSSTVASQRGTKGTNRKQRTEKAVGTLPNANQPVNALQRKRKTWGANKKHKKKAKQAKQVDEKGDEVVEHDWFDSSDEESEQLREAREERQQKEAGAAAKAKRQVVVKGFPRSSNDKAVAKYFHKCGEILEIACPKDDSGRPKGFAFITFDSELSAAKALAYDGNDFEARKLSVEAMRAKGVKDTNNKKGGSKLNDDDDDDDSEEELSPDDEPSDSEDGRAGGKGKGNLEGKSTGKNCAKGKSGKTKVKGHSKSKGKGKER